MSIESVLHAAADALEHQEAHRTERDIRNGAGGHMFTLLFETAKQMYGWSAICHLQRHIGVAQIQHWGETDPCKVVEALRAAAVAPVEQDVEMVAVREKMADFHAALADTMGWLSYDVATLVAEVGHEVARLQRDNERLAAELNQARRPQNKATGSC